MLNAEATEVRSEESVKFALDVTQYEFGEKCFKDVALVVTDSIVDETAIVKSLVDNVDDGISKVRVTTKILDVSFFAELLSITVVLEEFSNCVLLVRLADGVVTFGCTEELTRDFTVCESFFLSVVEVTYRAVLVEKVEDVKMSFENATLLLVSAADVTIVLFTVELA